MNTCIWWDAVYSLFVSQGHMDANGCNGAAGSKGSGHHPLLPWNHVTLRTSIEQLADDCVEQMKITISLAQNVFRWKVQFIGVLLLTPRIWIDYLIKSFGDFDTLQHNFHTNWPFLRKRNGKKGIKVRIKWFKMRTIIPATQSIQWKRLL